MKLLNSINKEKIKINLDMKNIDEAALKIAAVMEAEEFTIEQLEMVLEKVKSLIMRSKFKVPASEHIASLKSACRPKTDPPAEPFDIDKYLLGKEKEFKQSMDEFVSKLRREI